MLQLEHETLNSNVIYVIPLIGEIFVRLYYFCQLSIEVKTH